MIMHNTPQTHVSQVLQILTVTLNSVLDLESMHNLPIFNISQ